MFNFKDELPALSYTEERDFGEAGEADCDIVIDVDEITGSSYDMQAYARETETDAWALMGGMKVEAVNCNDGVLRIRRFRYVRVVVTITGGDLFAGTIGF